MESYTLQASTDGTIWTDYKGGGQVKVNGRVLSTCLGTLATRRLQASILKRFELGKACLEAVHFHARILKIIKKKNIFVAITHHTNKTCFFFLTIFFNKWSF